MAEGGAKLGAIKNELALAVREGVSSWDIEEKANKLIKASGGVASFKMVPKYHAATCVNINSGLVHGIPAKDVVFKKGDLVSLDVGLYYKGFHTDTSISVGLSLSKENTRFLEAGKVALKKAISEAKAGNRIFDISQAIQDSIESAGYTVIRSLVGHGIGKNLHEEPPIPCFIAGERARSPEITPGMCLAIEIMYTQGKADIEMENDGWTISMRDGKISALFEETVAISRHGPFILTEG